MRIRAIYAADQAVSGAPELERKALIPIPMGARALLLECLSLAFVISCAATPRAPAPSTPSPASLSAASGDPPKNAAVDPGLNPQMVADYVRSQLSKVRACYEWSLKTTPTLAGKIIMHWTIDADGAARTVGVESNSMPPSSVPGCLQALIEEWHFPKPARGNVDVSFPFVFRPSDGPVELHSGGEQAPI